MTFTFIDKLPEDFHSKPTLISGVDSLQFSGVAYLIIDRDNNDVREAFEIRYEIHCSPFKEAMIVNSTLAIGFEDFFYLFDIPAKTNILCLKLSGYFGHLYFDNGLFYVADADGLICIDVHGNTIWENKALGIDGVTISDFAEHDITGSGEWDPPGGWVDFVIDKKTGVKITGD